MSETLEVQFISSVVPEICNLALFGLSMTAMVHEKACPGTYVLPQIDDMELETDMLPTFYQDITPSHLV
jgi:hypothetical protein